MKRTVEVTYMSEMVGFAEIDDDNLEMSGKVSFNKRGEELLKNKCNQPLMISSRGIGMLEDGLVTQRRTTGLDIIIQ